MIYYSAKKIIFNTYNNMFSETFLKYLYWRVNYLLVSNQRAAVWL